MTTSLQLPNQRLERLSRHNIVDGPHYCLSGKTVSNPRAFLEKCLLYAIGASLCHGFLSQYEANHEDLVTMLTSWMSGLKCDIGVECELITRTLTSAVNKEILAPKACRRISKTGEFITDMFCLDGTSKGKFDRVYQLMMEVDPNCPAMVQFAQFLPEVRFKFSDLEWWSGKAAEQSPIVRWVPLSEQSTTD